MNKEQVSRELLEEAKEQLKGGRLSTAENLLGAARIMAGLGGRVLYDSLYPDLLACNRELIKALHSANIPPMASTYIGWKREEKV